jgi:hypothetical protein
MPRIERLHQNTSEWHRRRMYQLEVSGAEQARYRSFHGTDEILVEIRRRQGAARHS